MWAGRVLPPESDDQSYLSANKALHRKRWRALFVSRQGKVLEATEPKGIKPAHALVKSSTAFQKRKTGWILQSNPVFSFLVRLKRFELLAYRFVACCSIQLSYSRITRKMYSRTARIRQAFFSLQAHIFSLRFSKSGRGMLFLWNSNPLEEGILDARREIPLWRSSSQGRDNTVRRRRLHVFGELKT